MTLRGLPVEVTKERNKVFVSGYYLARQAAVEFLTTVPTLKMTLFPRVHGVCIGNFCFYFGTITGSFCDVTYGEVSYLLRYW